MPPLFLVEVTAIYTTTNYYLIITTKIMCVILVNSPILCDPIGFIFFVVTFDLVMLFDVHFHEEKLMHQLFSNHAKLANANNL